MEETTEEVVVVDVMPELEKQHYEDIKALNILVNDASYEHEQKKHSAKAAKEHLEGLQMRLSCLISEGPKKPDPQKELPSSSGSRFRLSRPSPSPKSNLKSCMKAGSKR